MISSDNVHAAPRLAALTPWVGQSSNVWMHRQFAQLADQLKTIIAWEYVNRDQFPLPNTEIRWVPERFAEPLDGWARTVDTLLEPRTGGSRYGRGFSRWLRNQLIECQAEAVLAQFGHYAMDVELACRGTGIPVFAHFHGHDLSARLRKKRYRRAIESHWHDFAGWIVVARYQRDYLLGQGIDRQAIALIPCGAPTREIAAAVERHRAASAPDPHTCRFLFVGRFTEKKDPLAVLKAFEICHRQQPHARLQMAGFGPLESTCREWLEHQRPELRQAVVFLGSLSPSQVVEALAGADALVQHSRVAADGDMEGWPVAIAEAMAARLPIVATRHAGIVDQVDEGVHGLLCDEGDWQSMGAQLAQLARNPQLRRRMGNAALQAALKFDSTIQIEQLRTFINERTALVSRSRRAA